MRRRTEALVCLGLGLLCIAGFHAVAGNGFVSVDDDLLVVDNPHVNSGLSLGNVRWAFTSIHASNWAPLAWLSHMLDCTLFGLDPRAHHLVNLSLHALNAILLFLVLLVLTRASRDPRAPGPDPLWPSALVAALFAIHPTRVESVAWVAERRDVLSTTFWILAIGAYAAWARRPDSGGASRRYVGYVAACILLALGLMTKPMLVTLPFVFLLLDYWPLRRIDVPPAEGEALSARLRPLLVEKLPMFALSAAACGIALLAQSRGGSVESLEVVPLGERVANALVSYARYLGLLVWPSGLAALYPRLPSEALSLGWRVVGSGALLLVITLLVLRLGRHHRSLPVGWLWFLGTLVPVIGLVQVGQQAMADRYTYVPYIGLFIALAFGAAELAAGRRARATALGLAAAVAIAALLAVTTRQVGYWKDSRTLFERAIAVTERNAIAYDQLASLHLAAGRFEKAVELGERAVGIQPDSVSALNNLGNALRVLHRTEEAERLYRRALAEAPHFPATRINLAIVRLERGADAEVVDLLAGAFDADPARAQDPVLARAYARSLRSQLEEGEVSLEEAVADYRRALAQLRRWGELVDELGWILATHPDATPEHGREALELELSRGSAKGRSAVGLDRLAVAYAAAGRFDEAVTAAERALERVGEGGSVFFVETLRERLALFRAGRPYRDRGRFGAPAPHAAIRTSPER